MKRWEIQFVNSTFLVVEAFAPREGHETFSRGPLKIGPIKRC
jgi:hypothetical protein